MLLRRIVLRKVSYLVEIVTLPFLLEVVEYTSVSYRTDAGVTLACGSVVLAFICVSFFARPGEKRYTEGMNCEAGIHANALSGRPATAWRSLGRFIFAHQEMFSKRPNVQRVER